MWCDQEIIQVCTC